MNAMYKIGAVLAASTIALTACGSPQIENVQVGDVAIRQIPVSGTPATPEGKLNLFIIIPVQARPLEERVALVQRYLEQEGKCRLGTTDLAKLDAYTRRAEGTDGRALMAPLKC